MHKKFKILTLIVTSTLVVWIYWATKTEMQQTLLFLSRNHNFRRKTLLNPANTTCQNTPFIIIIVTSYVGHVELRSAHRRAMDAEYLKRFNAERVFLLARIPKREKYITQEAIVDESRSFGDLLQGTFEEHYRNLTYKHLMGLDWASTKCANAKYILKVDDDTVFNLEATFKYLKKQKDEIRILGYMLNNTTPRRMTHNKWFVTAEEYPRSVYPPYLSGWYYVVTPKLAAQLVDEAIYHPYFWIDDIFITGVLTEALKIKLKQLPENFWLEYYELLECCLRDMVSKGVRCDHVVGPNGGRDNLIYEFNEALANCDKWQNCTNGSLEQQLKKVCFAFRDRTIFSDGHPIVENVRLF